MKEKIPLGILISGRGSNMSALLDACRQEDYPCFAAIVISNSAHAPGLEIARHAGVPTCVVEHLPQAPAEGFGEVGNSGETPGFRDGDSGREAFEERLQQRLRAAGVELLCNAGFMRILTPGFTEGWRDRQLNIHPSLLPDFPGIRVHERVLASGVKVTGCTVHYVRAEVDAGPIVAQATAPVLPDDTVATLAARVLRLEHRLYPRALRMVAEGRAAA